MKGKRFKISAGFAIHVFLFGLGSIACVLPDQDISQSERRRLASVPTLSFEAITDGTYMEDMENYLLDQFAGREWFRGLQSEFSGKVMQIRDSGGYFKVDDAIYKLEYELNEKNVRRAAENFAKISETYFPEVNIYYAVIPDKNYYLAEDSGYPVLPYSSLNDIMDNNFKNARAIPLSEILSLDDYYRTDLHWRQERIMPVAQQLLEAMGEKEPEQIVEMSVPQTAESEPESAPNYQVETATAEFYGGYAGASAFHAGPDTLSYLTDDVIANAVVHDYETGSETGIYAWEKLGKTDDYDFFLGGARALLTLENQVETQTGKKLILFRDSFGSSIAPLLLDGYDTVTLVDIRYVTAEYALQLLGDAYYDDVLFLYSASMLNHSDSMRF